MKNKEAMLSLFTMIALILFYAICVLAAPIMLFHFGPFWGIAAAVIACTLWIYFGPPAMPGFLAGLLGLSVFLFNLGWIIVALTRWLIQRAA